MIQAENIQKDCISTMRASGYIEIQLAGVIGITLDEQSTGDTVVSVFKVFKNSPADSAGISQGDILLSVDGHHVRRNSEAKILLFNQAYEPVSLSISKNGNQKNLTLIRIPYTALYGTPSK